MWVGVLDCAELFRVVLLGAVPQQAQVKVPSWIPAHRFVLGSAPSEVIMQTL